MSLEHPLSVVKNQQDEASSLKTQEDTNIQSGDIYNKKSDKDDQQHEADDEEDEVMQQKQQQQQILNPPARLEPDEGDKIESGSEKPTITPTSSSEMTHTLDSARKHKDIKKDVTILPTNTKGLHTVFIHKLYNMLEDDDLKHLIWWSSSNESFVIAPGEEFSKALAQYFKHTNVASFVRQLNMYGFHKVSDGANSDSSNDVTLWEFRHSSGSFRKGDIDSLKSIKRRSSKHASSKTIGANSDLSDNEGSALPSERSNSVTDIPPDVSVDPVLNVRLAELGHNLAALRHEHARLQLRYDTAIEDLRKTNLDMVFLLDLVQKLVRSATSENEQKQSSQNQNHTASPIPHQITQRKFEEEALPSPGSVPKEQTPYNPSVEIEHDIARFRASIIQRAASRDVDQYPVSFAPSYQLNPRTSQPPNATHPQQVQPPPPGPSAQNTPSGVNTPEAYPYPYPYLYPYPQQQQQGPPPSGHSQHQQQQQHLYPHPQQHHQQQQQQIPGPQIVQDPFHPDRKPSSSSSRSRNMSILYDPLAPAGSVISPASQSSLNRSSISGHVSNSDTNITSPTITQGSYFPDYGMYQRSHSPHQVGTRDQRSGSFPVIAPGIHNAIRSDGLMRKRHSSNDATDYSKSQEFNFSNPPRSIPVHSRPDENFHPEARKSISANSIHSLRSNKSYESLKNVDQVPTNSAGGKITPSSTVPSQSQPQLPTGSGVYALLNPSESGRRESVSGSGRPLPKKSRNV